MSYAIRNDGLGWRAVNGPEDVTADETYSHAQPTPVGVGVPDAITALDGLLALDAAGLADGYEAWANSQDRTFAERAFIAKAQTWRRSDPTLNIAAAALGLSDAQVDELFTMAGGA